LKITLAGVAHAIIMILLLIYSLANRDSISFAVSLSLILIFYNEYKTFSQMRRYISNIDIVRTIDKRICTELDDIEISISIENRNPIEFPRVVLIDVLPRYIVAEGRKPIFIFPIPPRNIVSIKYDAKVYAPGSHDFSRLFIIVSDPLNYFYEVYEFSARETIVSLPLSISSQTMFKSLQRLIGIYTLGKSIGGQYDLATFREYSPGDDIRKILWKHFAKSGKLIVREDYGETRARILVLIDMKNYLWLIGETPNSLAHIQLRVARSVVEYLSRANAQIDASICSGVTPKVYRNIEKNTMESLYNMMSVLVSGEGCESPLSILSDVSKYIGRDPEEYDVVILITNPITIAIEGELPIRELLKVYGKKLLILMPMFNYRDYMGSDNMNRLMSMIIDIVEENGMGIEMLEESFAIVERDTK